jgi:hypothetical protein
MHMPSAVTAGFARFTQEKPSKYLKMAGYMICLVIFTSNVWSMSHWNERRGVFDDIAYLRQAHLFQRFGIAGLDTDISHDDDGFFKTAAAEIRHIAWSDPNAPAPFMHTHMPESGKWVLQYPPGTGFMLALFPAGHQTIGLYVCATLIILLMSWFAIGLAATVQTTLLAIAFGSAATYFMINPAKSSYSVAPTMVLCAFAGYLTASLFASPKPRERLLLCASIGLLLGLSVNFRIANALLIAGYGAMLLTSFLRERTVANFTAGLTVAVGFLLGTVPTLVANAINAGSPFATTYSAVDAVPPDLSFSITPQYVTDLQGFLIVLAIGWTGWTFFGELGPVAKRVAQVTGLNLIVNLVFFLSHPIFTPYYLVPIAMLSLWSLLFASLTPHRRSNLMLATP